MKRNPKSAGRFVVLGNNDSIAAETVEIENRIRQRAFEISQSRGHAGRELEDWLSAESEIISIPPLELTEKNGAYTVQLALAGIDAGDVQVHATPDQVLIKAEYQHDHHEDIGTIHQCEFKSATLFRNVRFPNPVDADNVQVEFQDGLLRITAPLEGAKFETETRTAPAKAKAAKATKASPRRTSRPSRPKRKAG